MVMSSFLAGAEMMTFLAPPEVMWARALLASVNRPVELDHDIHAHVGPLDGAGVALGRDA